MNGFWTVCKRELKGYFATPVAYVFLVIFLFFAGYLPFKDKFFDIEQDPYEQKNLVNEKTEVAEMLKSELDRMYSELISSENIVNPTCFKVRYFAERSQR